MIMPAATLDLPRTARFEELSRRHPCLSGEAHGRNGRLHLPVSPVCNIECRFCTRHLDAQEMRPGVATRLLPPEEAPQVVRRALQVCPALAVVGVAGPGDSLASAHAVTALAAVHERFPRLIKCPSTNGLRLLEAVDDLVAAGVSTVTVTVNATDPRELAQLCRNVTVSYGAGRRAVLQGARGARTLIASQFEGIRAAVAAGIVVKVNTVLVPGVNDSSISDIAQTTREAGASLYNVIPLIPTSAAPDLESPDCAQVQSARTAAEQYLPVFRHCRQCRADALGVPGEGRDQGRVLYGDLAPGLSTEATFSHG
jgi:nitrogen fixation protein NifB